MISLRFYFHPSTFLHSLLHPTESLFIPASVISIGTILLNVTQYGLTPGKTGEWLLTTMNVLFWVYCGLAVVFSCGIYLIMFVEMRNQDCELRTNSRVQVVYPDIHDRGNDSGLDLPLLSFAGHWPPCWCDCKTSGIPASLRGRPRRPHRGFRVPGDRFFALIDDLRSLHIPIDDAEAAAGES